MRNSAAQCGSHEPFLQLHPQLVHLLVGAALQVEPVPHLHNTGHAAPHHKHRRGVLHSHGCRPPWEPLPPKARSFTHTAHRWVALFGHTTDFASTTTLSAMRHGAAGCAAYACMPPPVSTRPHRRLSAAAARHDVGLWRKGTLGQLGLLLLPTLGGQGFVHTLVVGVQPVVHGFTRTAGDAGGVQAVGRSLLQQGNQSPRHARGWGGMGGWVVAGPWHRPVSTRAPSPFSPPPQMQQVHPAATLSPRPPRAHAHH